MRRVLGLALVGWLCLGGAAQAEDDPSLQGLTFDRYYDVEALGEALRTIHEAFPGKTRLESMGQSREGRELWVMTVFDPQGERPPEDRPAMYIDANTHGNEVQGAEVCLFTIKYLLTRDDDWVRDLLRRVTFHVAPCVNPDSRHRFFHTPQDPHSPRRVLRPTDDDRDGRVDEDGPDDIDGDGHILRMRVADPYGEWVVDERDDRLMRRRRPGEVGQYRLLGREGTDEDGDGDLNEDGEGGVDPNRNWPSQWRPEFDQSGAGPYPLSEPETRATALWVLAHPRIAGVQSYHNAGQMILRPPAAWTDEESGLSARDREVYDEIGRRGLHVLPRYRYWQIREDLYRVFGGFVEWTFLDLGIFSFSNELWGRMGQEVPGEDDPQLAALRFNDVALHGKGFVRWHEVKHPDLGTVELGGWTRFTIRSDPPDFLPDTCLRNCLFTLEHAAMLPQVRMAEPRTTAPGEVTVVIENTAPLPTIHASARKHRVLPPDRITVDGGRVVGAVRLDRTRPAAVVEVEGGAALLPDGIDGNDAVTLKLFVEGEPTAVRFEGRLGGAVRAEIR